MPCSTRLTMPAHAGAVRLSSWCSSTLVVLVGAATIEARACDLPALVAPLPASGLGTSLDLPLKAQQGRTGLRTWAQWRVPEGEVVSTLELTETGDAVRLPASPQPWRPLKLSIEIQAVCAVGAASRPLSLRQLQFDPGAEARCATIEGLHIDDKGGTLRWTGSTLDTYELSIYNQSDGRLLLQRQITGTQMKWPDEAARPAIVRAWRSCGEQQRSRVTYQVVR